MSVEELNREQLIALKQNYLSETYYGIGYDELANADSLVPDKVILKYYAGYIFSEDDFLCSCD